MSKHFRPEEFASRDGKPSPYPEVVQPELYALLERIREIFGKPILINSGYRSPEHNAAVGGVKNSYHTKGMAADIRPDSLTDLKRLYEICDAVNHSGGVGKYKTFVHVDTRNGRARWNG